MSYEELLFGGGTTDAAPPANPQALDFAPGTADPAAPFAAAGFSYGGEAAAKRQKTSDEPATGASFHCNYCGKDLSHDGTFRIKCST